MNDVDFLTSTIKLNSLSLKKSHDSVKFLNEDCEFTAYTYV